MKVCTYMPVGFSDAEKLRFMTEFKKSCGKIYGISPSDTAIFIHECESEDLCESAAGSVFALFYIDDSASADQHEQTGKAFDEALAAAFDIPLKSSIVFRVHTKNNEARNGVLVTRL